LEKYHRCQVNELIKSIVSGLAYKTGCYLGETVTERVMFRHIIYMFEIILND